MKKIIAIVGMPGAGKSEAAAFFSEKGYPVLRFGEITDEGLREKGLDLTEENEKPFRESLRRELGMAAYAIKMEPKIVDSLKTQDIVFLDGLRSWEEYIYLREKFSNLYLLSIVASADVRYERLSSRLERSLTREEARSRDIAELNNLHMGPPIAIADWYIFNVYTKKELHRELQDFLKRTHDSH